MVERVTATPAALAVLNRLQERFGPVMLHQSGGCCDGSAPMCYPLGEFRLGQSDLLLGALQNGVCVYTAEAQYAHWRHTQLILDAIPGRGGGFSLETVEGMAFLALGRVFSADESAELGVSYESITPTPQFCAVRPA
jgi:uncharacterized protein